MEQNASLNNQGYEVEAIGPFENQVSAQDQLLKLTALLYLKEALVKQEYESCQELIGTAKKFGVAQSDISAVITEYLNGDNPRNKVSRLRSS